MSQSPAKAAGISSAVGQSTVDRFLQSFVRDGFVVSENPQSGEIKLIGIGPVGVKNINERGIFFYYEILAEFFKRDWLAEDCKAYAKDIGVSPKHVSTLLVISWNHLRLGSALSEEGDFVPAGHSVKNATIVSAPTTNPQEIHIPFLKEADLVVLRRNNVTSLYQLIGTVFSVRWDPPAYQKYVRSIGLTPSLGSEILTFVSGVLQMQKLTGLA